MLRQLAETTAVQLEVFRASRPREVMSVDKEIELMVGEKERRIGAMRQHAAEHKCQTIGWEDAPP